MDGTARSSGVHGWSGAAAGLRRDGYCVVPGVLDAALLGGLRQHAKALLEALDTEHRRKQRSTGSLIHIAEDPYFATLIAWPAALDAFARLDLGDARFSSGYVISKPPGGPPLFWHQDWWGWDHPASYTDRHLQVFAMYYLTDTTVENGCLRVFPGSHRRRHPSHDRLARAHGEDLARVRDPADPAFATLPEEVAVPVRAGDMVIGDARMLHGAHANSSGEERTLLTLWYHPHFAEQPGPIRARVATIMHREEVDTDPDGAASRFPDCWPADVQARLAPVLTHYEGSEPPLAWNRVPDRRLT